MLPLDGGAQLLTGGEDGTVKRYVLLLRLRCVGYVLIDRLVG